MCSDSTLVPIPAFLQQSLESFDAGHPEFALDAQGRKCFVMDACIVEAVKAVWDAGVKTLGCCCGHGQGYGVISLDLGLYDRPKAERPTAEMHHCSMCGGEHRA